MEPFHYLRILHLCARISNTGYSLSFSWLYDMLCLYTTHCGIFDQMAWRYNYYKDFSSGMKNECILIVLDTNRANLYLSLVGMLFSMPQHSTRKRHYNKRTKSHSFGGFLSSDSVSSSFCEKSTWLLLGYRFSN